MWRITLKDGTIVQSDVYGAFQEGRAAGMIIGKDARNPYKEAANGNSFFAECSSAWKSGKVKGLTSENSLFPPFNVPERRKEE